jgi:hypothetical protein
MTTDSSDLWTMRTAAMIADGSEVTPTWESPSGVRHSRGRARRARLALVHLPALPIEVEVGVRHALDTGRVSEHEP